MKKDNVLDEWQENDVKLDKKKARKLIWRTRLSISFTVIRTIAMIAFLYMLYIIPVTVIYDTTGKQAAFDRLVTTLVETRNPGISVDKTLLGHNATISPWLTQKTNMNLIRHVGEWEVNIGEVSAKKTLFGKVNYSLNLDSEFLNNNELYNFTVAPNLIGRKVVDDGSNQEELLFDQLEKIDDGYVVQVHFSTKEGMDPNALLKILNEYDIRTYEMPVYAGELKSFDVSHSRAGQYVFIPSLILNPMLTYDKKNRMSSSYGWLTADQTLDESIEQLYKNLNWLIDNGSYHGKKIDEKRLKYLKKNGLKVFGATVTGPIREVEKLKAVDAFHQFYLDGIEVWNWESGK